MVKQLETIETFKKYLDIFFLLNIEIEPNLPGYKSILANTSSSMNDQQLYKKNIYSQLLKFGVRFTVALLLM